MRFALDAIAGLSGEPAELAGAILDEAAKFAAGELAPLNSVGDRVGSVLENGVVRTPPGFREAYHRYVEAGWNGLASDPEFGGQGLPISVAVPVIEMWNSACMGWALCPLLNHGALALLEAHGSPEQKRIYLDKLVSGEWTGTMNLTEPQAGSDLGALRTRAMPANDADWGDHYRISGQKIFITYGDHDLTGNIVHMVLARTPDAPPGSRGISLFLVPKFLPEENAKPGRRNDIRTLRVEEKLGIHASPTCVLSYGEEDGAIGWRIGEENRGLECMFTMMNSERLLVAVQGVAIAEAAYQHAREYARTRVQGRPVGGARDGAVPPIIAHPDVRRMLLAMRAGTEAARALVYLAAAAIDAARNTSAGETQYRTQQRADLLIPIAKAWCTDLANEIASTGVQIHGGMGYIEETGAAQFLRDARILPIYEGTNGIQANDLVGRKLARDRGETARELIAEMRATAADPAVPSGPIGPALTVGIDAVAEATEYLVAADPATAAAGSVPYLALFGTVLGGWLLTRQTLALTEDNDFAVAKRATARFYAAHYLPRAMAHLPATKAGGTIVGFDPELL
jgi:alkylation response protein AidB-like acyl-CoA dehydrogenase